MNLFTCDFLFVKIQLLFVRTLSECGNNLICIAGAFAQDYSKLPVTQACLGCICEAASGCDTTQKCGGDVCGPFRITWAYWADAGKPTVNNEKNDTPTAYSNCASDTFCAALAVQGYMQKFQQVRKRPDIFKKKLFRLTYFEKEDWRNEKV